MRRKQKSLMPDAPLAPVPSAILDEFLQQGPVSVEEVEAAVRRFKKALIERALGAELSHHLGYPPGGAKPEAATNHRNGTSGKTVLTDDGPLAIDVRATGGDIRARLIPKHERRFTGFDDKIVAMYARGLTVREIQAFLAEVRHRGWPDLISTVTDAVMAEVTAWQSRPLEAVYPVVFFDALRVKIRERPWCGTRRSISRWRYARRHARHPGPVDREDRGCQVLDEGVQRPEDARLNDILIAVTDGLKGMPEALAAVFPRRRCKPASST